MLRTGLQRAISAAAVASSAASGSTAACLEQAVARGLPAALGRSAWLQQRHYSSEEEKREITDPTVIGLADQIVALNLLQVSDLTELLKQKLGIQAPMGGFPMGGFAMPGGGAAPAAAAADAAPAAAPVEEKTEWGLKLEGFDAAAKIKVIKEVRAITGLGLKEAKELVEGAPQLVKAGLKKDEAEALLKTLADAGAKVSLE